MYGSSQRQLTIAYLLVLLTGCTVIVEGDADLSPPAETAATEDTRHSDRNDAPLIAEPPQLPPGATVTLQVPDSVERGNAWILQSEVDGAWTTAYYLSVNEAGKTRSWAANEVGDGAVDDIDLTGTGPVTLRLPADLPFGKFRICVQRQHGLPIGPCAEIAVDRG